MNAISNFIEAHLRKLQAQNIQVSVGPKKLGEVVDRINNGMSKMAVELDNGQDFDTSTVTPFANPFKKQPVRGVFMTADGCLQLEVTN